MDSEYRGSKFFGRLVRIDYVAYFIIFICVLLGVPDFMIQTGNQETLNILVNNFYTIISIHIPWWTFLIIAGISFLFSLLA